MRAKPGSPASAHGARSLWAALALCASSLAAGECGVRVVDAAGQPVADAVVLAYPAEAPDVTAKPATVLQQGQEFLPYVTVVQVGAPVSFPNEDTVQHHVYSFSPAKQFDLPLYHGKPATPVVFDKPGPVALGCNIHDWMVAYIYVADTQFAEKTGESGSVRFAELKPGPVTFRVWHPRLRGEPLALKAELGSSLQEYEMKLPLKPLVRRARPGAGGEGGYK